MDINLKFVNNTVGAVKNDIVIFQKNVAEDFDEIAVAWEVIKNCGVNCYHPFVFPLEFSVGAADSYGNFTEQMPATTGDAYEMYMAPSGNDLRKMSVPATNPKDVEVRNNLTTGAISANIYKGGDLLAAKSIVVPGQKAVFQFLPKLYIGAVSEIQKGTVMNSAVISQCNTELDLLGVKSADIVMTGGGGDQSATAYLFRLQNVVYL